MLCSGHSACYVADYLNSAPSLRKMGKSVAGIAAAKAASGNANMVLTLEETGGSYQVRPVVLWGRAMRLHHPRGCVTA